MDADAYNKIAGLDLCSEQCLPTVRRTQVHYHTGDICRSKDARVYTMIISTTSVSRYVTKASCSCIDAGISHS